VKLQTVYNSNLRIGTEAIAADKELSTQIQTLLVGLKLLSSPADGKFGPVSTAALLEFQSIFKDTLSIEQGFLGKATAEKLIEISLSDIEKLVTRNVDASKKDLAARVIQYMLSKRYEVFTGEQQYNIVYIEGMNSDGILNDDAPNTFDDLRTVIEIVSRVPILVGYWQGTTEPGIHYTMNPVNQRGAARIAFGQYKAWQVGTHFGSGSDPHEALVQVGNITVHRDRNQDFVRTGDYLDTSDSFGLNQHWGFDLPSNDIGFSGSGSLIGRRREGHREFMGIIKKDQRYLLNNDYTFVTTIIPGDDLARKFPL
jgi:hypothetical protein